MRYEFFEGYVCGMLDMAASRRPHQNPSMITAYCFDVEEAAEEIEELTGIDEEEVGLYKVDEEPEQMLWNFFGDDEGGHALSAEIAERLAYQCGPCLGAARFAAEAALMESLSGYGGGKGPYYITEEVFAFVYAEYTVMFVVGNDE